MASLRIEVRPGGIDTMCDRALDTLARIEAGETVRVVPTLSFPDWETLFRHVTPRRIELLRYAEQHRPGSIRKIAEGLKRDYKSVHGDVTALLKSGLLLRDARGFDVFGGIDDVAMEDAA